MHAPATPGTSDSGGAAGSDSGQGSGSNVGPTEVQSFDVSSVTLKLDSTTGPINESPTNSINYLNGSESIGIEIEGANLDKIETAVITYSDGYNATDIDLTKMAVSTDTVARFISREFPKDNIFYIDAVIINGEYIIDKRESVKKIYIGAYVNSGYMGWVSGGGLVNFGSEITLVPNAAAGYRFVRWEDGVTEANRTIVADREYQFRAIFTSGNTDSDEDIPDEY